MHLQIRGLLAWTEDDEDALNATTSTGGIDLAIGYSLLNLGSEEERL